MTTTTYRLILIREDAQSEAITITARNVTELVAMIDRSVADAAAHPNRAPLARAYYANADAATPVLIDVTAEALGR